MTKIRWNQYNETCPCRTISFSEDFISCFALSDINIKIKCQYEKCPFVYWKDKN